MNRTAGTRIGAVLTSVLAIACTEGDSVDHAGSTTHASTTGVGGGAGGGGGGGAGGSAGGPDGGSDPGAPTVFVIPDCVGVSDIAVELSTTENNEFTIDGRPGFFIALSVDDVVRFSTASDHNFESVPGTPSEFFFRSGDAGPHTACLRFTAPTTRGPVGFECDPHAGDGMVGSLTVE